MTSPDQWRIMPDHGAMDTKARPLRLKPERTFVSI